MGAKPWEHTAVGRGVRAHMGTRGSPGQVAAEPAWGHVRAQGLSPHPFIPPSSLCTPASRHLRGERIKETQSRSEAHFGCNFLCSIIDKQAASRR